MAAAMATLQTPVMSATKQKVGRTRRLLMLQMARKKMSKLQPSLSLVTQAREMKMVGNFRITQFFDWPHAPIYITVVHQ